MVIGDDVLIGPHAHVNGARIGREAFIATRAALFPGSRVGVRAEVRIGGVVHVNSSVADGAVVPIGWVAVGDQAACRRTATTRSGRSRKGSTSPARSTASRAATT